MSADHDGFASHFIKLEFFKAIYGYTFYLIIWFSSFSRSHCCENDDNDSVDGLKL
jgi:hypothetical protein